MDQLQLRAEKYAEYNVPVIFHEYGVQSYMDGFKEGEMEAFDREGNKLIWVGCIIGALSTSVLFLTLKITHLL